MMSSNFTGISMEYGDTIIGKIKGCGFHYHQSVQRQIRSLDEPHQTIFNSLANDMAKATIPEAYTKAYGDLYSFIVSTTRRNIEFRGYHGGMTKRI